MKGLRPAILVGVLLMVALGVLAYLVSITGRRGLGNGESILVHMTFADATGLVKRSRVTESGIDIGKLESVKLVKGKVIVTIRVSNEYPLYQDASVLKRSESLLSDDARLDIDPGTEGRPRIPNDGWITDVRTAPSMDAIMASVQHIANDTQRVTGSLAGAVGTPEGQQDIANILKQLNETITQVNRTTAVTSAQIAHILGNLEALSTDLRRLAPAQEQQIVEILKNIREITEQTKQTIGVVHDVVHDEQGNVKDAMVQMKDAIGKVDATMGSAQKVAEGVEQGKGVVGKLLRDDELANRLDNTIKSVSAYVDRLTGLKLEVGMRAEIGLEASTKANQFYIPTLEQIGAKIIPAGSSRFIGFDVVSDSLGNVSHTVTNQVINGASLQTLTDTYSESLSVNAYLGQHWGPATLRVGLIESTGGVGADVDAIPKWLSFHVDAFNFTPANGELPRIRTYAQFTFDHYFDLIAGGDDLLNGPQAFIPDPHGIIVPGGRFPFVGAGFHFTDDDLKAIIGMTGIPKP